MRDEKKSSSTAREEPPLTLTSELINEADRPGNTGPGHEEGHGKHHETLREPESFSGSEFLSPISWSDTKADTLIIHCSDHRFKEHFDAFIHNCLSTKPDVLAIPGGPQVLIAASYIEKFEWAGRRWVKYLRDNHNLRRIVCIAHVNCGWYRNITVGGLTIPLLKDRQISDLKKIRLALHDMFPKTESEAWYADVDGNHVKFVKIL